MDVLYCSPLLVSGNITHPCNSRYLRKIFLFFTTITWNICIISYFLYSAVSTDSGCVTFMLASGGQDDVIKLWNFEAVIGSACKYFLISVLDGLEVFGV